MRGKNQTCSSARRGFTLLENLMAAAVLGVITLLLWATPLILMAVRRARLREAGERG